MSSKRTLIIALIFLAAAGAFWFDQQRHAKQEEREIADSRLLAPKADELTGMTMKRAGKLHGTVKMVKEDKFWKLVEPLRSRTDDDQVKTLLGALDYAKKSAPFDPEGGNLTGYGLTTPTLTVSFSRGRAKETLPDLQIGDETPDDNAVYARMSDQKQVFTIDKIVVRMLGKTLPELRDKRLLPANLTEATSITLAFEGHAFSLQKDGGHWKLTSPRRLKADDNAVANILSTWNNLRTQSFIDAGPVNLTKAGLVYPYVAATAYVNGDDGLKNYSLMVGDVATSIPAIARFAMRVGESLPVFLVNDSLAKKLRPTLDDLHDKTLFTLDNASVGRIDLTSIHHRMPLSIGANGKWRLDDSPKDALDQNTIKQKLNSLVGLKATRFFDDDVSTVKTGLDSPNVLVTLVSKDGKTSQTLATGRKSEDADFVYCRFRDSSGRDQLIGVDWTRPGDFFMTRQDLLDKTIFSFKPDQARRLTIWDDKTSVSLTRMKTGGWELQKIGADGKPSGDKNSIEMITVNNFLQTICSVEWKRRLDPADAADAQEIKKFHLDAPTRWIAFHDANGALLARMGQGDSDDELARVKTASGACYEVDGFRMISYLEELRRIWRVEGLELQPLKQGAAPEVGPKKSLVQDASSDAPQFSPEELNRIQESAGAAKAPSKTAKPAAASADGTHVNTNSNANAAKKTGAGKAAQKSAKKAE